MTTVHAYTGDQMLLDGPHKDLRRALFGGGQHRAPPPPARPGPPGWPSAVAGPGHGPGS